MKIVKISTGLVLLFLLAAAGFAQSQDPPDPSELKRRVVKRIYNDVSDADRWEIEAAYPDVRLKGDGAAEGFNRTAKALVMSKVSRFKKDMAGDAKNNSLPDGVNYYQSIEYSVSFFDEDLVSVLFLHSEYTGGAHPNHWTYTLTYDLAKDNKKELSDFFKPQSKYLDIISRYSISSIMERMGENADGDWVKTGAGPTLKNFSSWNVTEKGFLFSFDPYQVGPYAAGSFESVIPYENFPEAVRGAEFYKAESASYIDGSPPTFCRGGRWTMLDTPYQLAVVKGKKNTRAFFYGDEGDCPNGKNCNKRSYVIAGDEVIVQREYGDFSCVWYQPSKGEETVGWLKTDAIETRADAFKPPGTWVGEWSYSSSQISIKESPSGKLHVYGTAFWKGLGDNVHVGEIDFLNEPVLDLLQIGGGDEKYDCRVRLRRIGKYLLVNDNLRCGGLNVTFNGVYGK